MQRIFTTLLLFSTLLFAGLKEVDVDALLRMQKEGIAVIDIRTQREWQATGIIAGSHPITFFKSDGSYDLDRFMAALRHLGIDKHRPFILVCRSASRTKVLGNFLADRLGYNAYELKGGILRWKALRKPLVSYKPQ